ncbi:hypothetical protein C2845_PM03G22450 [Panicum miliaceum]|uniref:AAA+ ATPase domain-containing protein n=1 Tax=Panicum miliaceum TaxID=4540 RepID=A0A3L6T9S9_PANMI|nr:hypothetical protein C2845_PM03G22450 [Panicum miliaceum]
MLLDFHLRPLIRRLLPFLDPYVTIDISGKPDYYSMDRIKSSDAYEEVKAYLSPACARDALELDGDGFVLSPREGQEVSDEFKGVAVRWASVRPGPGRESRDQHCLCLTFHRRHRELVVGEYLPHVRRLGRDAMFGNRRRRLYTNKKNIDYCSSNKVWSYIDFEHPTTFDTLAMHPEKKRKIMDDLDDFRSSREYYRRVGKAWKRGYLLYGPPGTGKSSMIAAMANYLNYDIYDIELTMVPSNNDLRKLFIETKGKSIIVIEDIDCSLDLTGHRSGGSSADAGAANPLAQLAGAKRKRASEMMLSGLLNFIDGIWSAHSGERIIVFTTNHAERLDPALVRRGRMDMRVEMSYCCFEAFTTLARNYLGEDAHPLFGAVEEMLRAVEITPADVAECLMMSRRTERGADVCLGRLVDELKKRAEEKGMKRAEKEAAAPAAAGADATEANGGGADMAKGRRMVDPRTIPLLDFDISATLESCGSMACFVAIGTDCHNITMVARRGKIVRGLKFVQQMCGLLQ